MGRQLYSIIAAGLLLSALIAAEPACAQKQGGILKSYSIDSPASMSIHEEVTVFALRPAMGVFNNLVIYDQHVKQNSMQSIVPELAKSWAWDEDGTRLTFKLHEGVNGTTESRSLPGMSNAPGTCCEAKRARSCASTPAKPGTATSR